MANFLKSLFVKGIEIDPAGATSAQVLSYNGTKFAPVTNSATATTDASALTSGTLDNARLPAAATNITSVGTLGSLAVTNGVTAATFTGALTGNASTATNVDYTGLTGTVPTWNQNTTGNAATVTTNANLTGGVTSVGNAATVVTNANLTGGVTSVGNAATVITNANLTGDVTSVGNATTLTNAPVIAKVLTGYVSGSGTVAATDSILQAVQKLNGNDALKATIANPTFTGTVTAPIVVGTLIGSAADTDSLRISGGYPDNVVVGGNIYLYGNTHATRAADVAIQSNGNEILTVDGATLRVGIGVLSPTTALDVSGTITATTFNKVTVTAPATGSTLTIADGKTLTASNTLTFTGTDASSVAFGAGGTVAYTSVTTLSSLISVGTIGTGVWQGTAIAGQYGGTGVANTGKTITLGGNLTTSGAFTTTLTATANTSLTLPSSGTVISTANLSSITSVGTLTGLTVDGASSPSFTIGDWAPATQYSGITGNTGYLLVGTHAADTAVYLRTSTAGAVHIGANGTNTLSVGNGTATLTGTLTATGAITAPSLTGTGAGHQNNFVKLSASANDSTTVWGYSAGTPAYANLRTYCQYDIGVSWISTGTASPSGYTPNAHATFMAGTTHCGDIRSSASNTTTYNTSSDYRLKENITEISDAIERIRRLRPVSFQFKDPNNDIFYDGFLAHEIEDIAPYAVSGTKDAVTADGDIIPQMIDMSTMVGLLTAGIKELDARLAQLETI